MAGAMAMCDLLTWQALDGVTWDVAGVSVYQHAPRNAAYPLVIVGDVDGALPIGRAGDPDMTMTVSVLVLTQDEERGPCVEIVDQVITALDGVTVSGTGDAVGWKAHFAVSAGSATIAEDGQGYVGAVQFAATVLKE